MAEDADPRPDKIAATVGRQAERKERARREQRHGLWFGFGMFGLVGWAVAVPTLLGIALGIWLDANVPVRFSWTLTLLFIGIGLGCLNAWWWIRREKPQDRL